jgi:hypothetical protein
MALRSTSACFPHCLVSSSSIIVVGQLVIDHVAEKEYRRFLILDTLLFDGRRMRDLSLNERLNVAKVCLFESSPLFSLLKNDLIEPIKRNNAVNLGFSLRIMVMYPGDQIPVVLDMIPTLSHAAKGLRFLSCTSYSTALPRECFLLDSIDQDDLKSSLSS